MQETQGTNRPDDTRSQNIFHRENGPASSEDLQRDEAFRAFFTKTVIEVPEDMRHVTGQVLLEEEEEKPKKKGFWPWFRRKKQEEAEEAEAASDPAQDALGEISFTLEPEAEPEPEEEPAPDVVAEPEPEEEPAPEDVAEPEPEAEPAPAPRKPTAPVQICPPVQPRISPEEVLRRTAGQKISVDELLSQIDCLETGKPLRPAAPAVPQPAPQADPLERLQRQTRNAAEGKKELDARLANQPAAEETPSTLQLVEEEMEPETPVQRTDTDDRTVEIPLNLVEEAVQPAEKREADTGEICLTPQEEELPVEEPAEEVGEIRFVPEDAPGLPAAEAADEPAAEAPTGEILLEPEDASVPDVAEETAGTVVFPSEEDAESDAEPDAAEEETLPDAPERKPWRDKLQQMLETLGMLDDEDEEEAEEEEDADAEADAPLSAAAEQAPEKKGLFGKLSPEKAEPEAPAEPPVEYNSPEDAPRVQELLEKRCRYLTFAAALAGILSVALLVLDVMGQMGKAPLAGIDPVAAPTAWLCVNLVLLAVCALLDLPGLAAGCKGLVPGGSPTADTLSVLAAGGAGLQLVLALLLPDSFDPTRQAVFAGMAAVIVFVRLLGKRMSAASARESFITLTDAAKHTAAYRLQNPALTEALCSGMESNDPAVLLSRPGALLSGFVAQSNAPHYAAQRAVLLARILGGCALVGSLISLVRTGNVVTAGSVLAGMLAMGTPMGILLLRGLSTLLMARSASRVGAVVPGWPAIAQLGEVDVLHVDAAQLFPPVCAYLNGIKTFREERIDSAILYATSILIAGCNTLEGLFRGMIENHTDMLYPVQDLECRQGLGFVAWCDHCRVLLGTREMMQQEGISLPALEYENRYSHNGSRHVLYLAVSGELYAMFLFGYNGTKQVARTLNVLRRENIQLVVTAADPTLTQQRIEAIYRLRPGSVKVLCAAETEQLAPAVASLPCQDGCLAHTGSIVSMVGGLCAAAGAEDAQRSGSLFQTISTLVSVVIGLLLSVTGGMATISLGAVILYQLAWLVVCLAVAATKKY